MMRGYTSNITLHATASRVCAIGPAGCERAVTFEIGRPELLVLELFVHSHDVASVQCSFQSILSKRPATDQSAPPNGTLIDCVITLATGQVQVLNRTSHQRVDFTAASLVDPGVLTSLFASSCRATAESDPAMFPALFTGLVKAGALVPMAGAIEWGDWRRAEPFSEQFGFSRGTPIDRYYLDRFVDRIRSRVSGDTIEVGVRTARDSACMFPGVTSYRTIDIEPRRSPDVIGDVQDGSLLPPSSLDSIILFNVLEHCVEPATVIANAFVWLRAGGRLFLMVPNAQRVHGRPNDYWRMNGAALRHLCRRFAHVEVHAYGNFTTTIAALAGIAAEELSRDDIDQVHPDYPVATCVVATKAAHHSGEEAAG